MLYLCASIWGVFGHHFDFVPNCFSVFFACSIVHCFSFYTERVEFYFACPFLFDYGFSNLHLDLFQVSYIVFLACSIWPRFSHWFYFAFRAFPNYSGFYSPLLLVYIPSFWGVFFWFLLVPGHKAVMQFFFVHLIRISIAIVFILTREICCICIHVPFNFRFFCRLV